MARYSPERGALSPDLRPARAAPGAYRRLRWRLRTGLLAASVLPLSFLSLYFHFQYQQTQRASIHSHLRSVAENHRNTADLYLRERLSNLRSTFRQLARALNGHVPALQAWLLGLQQESPAFVDLGLFDAQGTLVGYAGEFPHLVGRCYAKEGWWQTLTQGPADSIISDVYLGFRQRPHFVIALRRQVAGRRWVLRASVDPERFNRFIRRPHLSPEAEAFLVNPRGQRQTQPGSARPTPAATPPSRAEGRLVVRERTVGGQAYITAYAWLAEHQWAVAVRVPRDRVYASLTRARWTLIAFTAVVLVLIVIAVFYYSGALVRHLHRNDRERETLQQELFHASKLATLGEMAAGVAHEINNPLAVVYEEAGMMRDLLDPELSTGMSPDDFQERLGAIQEAALRGRGITHKLLTFARAPEPEPEPTDLNEIVRRAVASRERSFALNEITITQELDAALPPLMVKGGQLEQVLLNLLNNARDAIGDRGTIHIVTGRQGATVVCRVTDSGCGIPEAQLPQIFVPFYTTKGVGRGTGLGLSISYGIIRSFGGDIEVDSTVGQGTTFTLRFPMAPEAPRRGTTPHPLQEVADHA